MSALEGKARRLRGLNSNAEMKYGKAKYNMLTSIRLEKIHSTAEQDQSIRNNIRETGHN